MANLPIVSIVGLKGPDQMHTYFHPHPTWCTVSLFLTLTLAAHLPVAGICDAHPRFLFSLCLRMHREDSTSPCPCVRTGRSSSGWKHSKVDKWPCMFSSAAFNGKFEAESQRNNAIKKTDSYSQFPGERGTGCHVGHRRNPRAGHEAEGEQGPVGVTFYGGFCRKEWARQPGQV